jgi:uncharacterized RDD family membrane protein YckC
MTELVAAGFWRRLAAHLLDCLLGFGAWLLGSMWLLIGVWELRGAPRDLRELFVLALALPLVAVVLHLAYHVLMLVAWGQTLGKMAVGVIVVRRDGGPVGVMAACLRCLGGFLSAATLGLGYVGILVTREGRGLADMLAGTRVVDARWARAAAVPELEAPTVIEHRLSA